MRLATNHHVILRSLRAVEISWQERCAFPNAKLYTPKGTSSRYALKVPRRFAPCNGSTLQLVQCLLR